MQDGSFSYPPDGSDFKYLLELRAEAEYYGLTGLLENIDRYPVSSMHVTEALMVIFTARVCGMACLLMLPMHHGHRSGDVRRSSMHT